MSEHGRYGSTAYESRGRSRERGWDDRDRRGRGDESIFSSGDWRERDRDRGHRDNQPGGWLGDGRTSDYDRRGRESGYGRQSGRERHYGPDDDRQGLPINETSRMIASNKVEGTPVYNFDGDRLGTIYNFMVDKHSGQVEYAVMSYGGFLGIGQRYFPLPWRILTYHRDQGGFVIDMDERDLERAPSFDRNSEPRFDRDYDRHVRGWYGLNY